MTAIRSKSEATGAAPTRTATYPACGGRAAMEDDTAGDGKCKVPGDGGSRYTDSTHTTPLGTARPALRQCPQMERQAGSGHDQRRRTRDGERGQDRSCWRVGRCNERPFTVGLAARGRVRRRDAWRALHHCHRVDQGHGSAHAGLRDATGVQQRIRRSLRRRVGPRHSCPSL